MKYYLTLISLLGILNLNAQSKIAIYVGIDLDSLSHKHIGFTVFNNFSKKYPANNDYKQVIINSFDSLSKMMTLDYDIIELETETSKLLKATKRKKWDEILDTDSNVYKMAIVILNSTYHLYTSKSWYFEGIGFYTMNHRACNFYTAFDYTFINPLNSKIFIFDYDQDNHESSRLNKFFDTEERKKNYTIEVDKLSVIESGLKDYVTYQILNLFKQNDVINGWSFIR